MATKERSDLGRTQGFSLVEILVVVGIIAVMGAVAIPAAYNYFRTYQIRAAAQQVAGELQATRLQAIKRNANFGVVFVVLSDSTYQYFSEDIPLDGAQHSYAEATAIDPDTGASIHAGRIRSLPSQVKFVAAPAGTPNTGLRFNRLGAMCEPTAGSTTCRELTASGLAATPTFVYFNAGDASIVLQQDNTGLQHTVTVARGGRIRVQ